MSVGDAYGVLPHDEVDATIRVNNLAEARALQSARAAAANLNEPAHAETPAGSSRKAKAKRRRRTKRTHGSKRKGKARARSYSPIRKAQVPASVKSAASSTNATRERRRATWRDSLEAREATQELFDSGDEPPARDDTEGEEKGSDSGHEREHQRWEREHAARLSMIETPASQRVV